MIKTLRLRFILVSMLSVICVLSVIMAAVNISSSKNSADKADELAAYIADHDGRFPSFSAPAADPYKPSYKPSGTSFSVSDTDGSDTAAAPEAQADAAPPDGLGTKHGFTSETPFETRFFTVRLTSAGEVSEINLGSIFSVTDETAASLAQQAASKASDKGYTGGYRYLVREAEDGSKMVVFVDNHRELSSQKSFLRSSLLVSAAGILAVFFLVLALSRRVISPIAEAYEKQKRFITDASHELKTPLTVIDASAEVIAMEQGESEWISTIRSEVKRLTALTNSLVSLTRMDEADSHLVMTDFSLSDAVEETAEPFLSLAASRGLGLTLSIEKNLSYNGCESALRQLVSILLDNAVKYSADGGEIALSLKRQGGRLHLSCKNPTAPMKKGSHDELFRRFYRADDSRNSATGGFGIGLSLARATAEAHKGKILAVSEDGASLTVTAVL